MIFIFRHIVDVYKRQVDIPFNARLKCHTRHFPAKAADVIFRQAHTLTCLLDVYKRQAAAFHLLEVIATAHIPHEQQALDGLYIRTGRDHIPVSYTHLSSIARY